MINNLGLLGAVGATENIANNANMYGVDADQSSDFLGLGGTLGGGLLGALAGGYLGNAASNKALLREVGLTKEQIKEMGSRKDLLKRVKGNLANESKALSRTVAPEAKGIAGKLKGGSGKLTSLMARNPRAMAGGGALVGAMLGSQLLGNALTRDRRMQTAAQMQSIQQQDAQRQQRDLMALQRGMNIRF